MSKVRSTSVVLATIAGLAGCAPATHARGSTGAVRAVERLRLDSLTARLVALELEGTAVRASYLPVAPEAVHNAAQIEAVQRALASERPAGDATVQARRAVLAALTDRERALVGTRARLLESFVATAPKVVQIDVELRVVRARREALRALGRSLMRQTG